MKLLQGVKTSRKKRRFSLTKELNEAQCGWSRVKLERGVQVRSPIALWAMSRFWILP